MKGLFADDSRMGHVASGKQYPLQNMPLFVSNDSNIASHIIPVAGKTLAYKTTDIIYPAKFHSLELVPFYKVHQSRYVVYWQKETSESIKAIQQKLALQEEAAAKLAAVTIDMVKAGEQQPESDHFIESENSSSGVNKDSHWRDAKGWFSYKLIDKERKAGSLRITYYGRDKDRGFKILVNGETIAEEKLDGSHGDEFFTVDYPLTEDVVQKANGQLTVKFLASEGSVAGGIYEVRLLKR
jgi:hypothetical protein